MSQNSSATTRPRSLGRRLRPLALVTAAAGVAATLIVSLTATPPTAGADPGDTYVPIGTSQLVQSEDLASIELPYNSQKIVLGKDSGFSNCLSGTTTWTQLLPGSAAPITATWRQRGHHGEMVELIAQARTETQAKQWEAKLITSAVRACTGSDKGWHYGSVHHDRVGNGEASWALLYTGTRRHADGGVVVIRKGTDVGFVDAEGDWAHPGQTMESVAKVAVDRLVG